MNRDYEIGMLWVEGPLSYVEVLCARSFVDAGHHVKLYHYGPVQNVPEGVELVHGDAVLRIDRFIQHGRTGSFALFSDVFRYHLLRRNDRMIWADLDAYCLRPFESATGHFFGWESRHHINGGVLGLPPDSDALGRLLAMTEDEYAIPEWFAGSDRAELEALAAAGTPRHVSEMPWGVWGPHALTHYLTTTGEAKHALPRAGLYPVGFRDRRHLLRKGRFADVEKVLTPQTYSIHFYGRRVKEFLASEGGLPERGSYLDGLLKKHGVDPRAAPVRPREEKAAMGKDKKTERMTRAPESKGKTPREVVSVPAVPPAVSGRGAGNLTDLADRFGSDKGSAKHRYTELYHMLFHPFRGRRITFLEMGLLIGGPEHGVDKDRATNDLPSVRMWLEYFPKAQVHGLDVSDFSWFTHERFTFHRCDMDDRAAIRDAIATISPAPAIVIDDASHASHHQQNAFLEIFPRLAPGGLYVIEDLRWQPDTYERKGITKTAALFRSWLDERRFIHSDPAVAEEFNALAPMISGCIVEPVRYQKGRKDQVAVIHKR